MLDLGLTHADLDAWQASYSMVSITVADAVNEFLAVKKANKGLSSRNVRSLKGYLDSLVRSVGPMPVVTVQVSDLNAWLAAHANSGPRNRRNLRAAAVTFFKWARRNNYLPDKTTAAEHLESPIVPRKVPATYTPEELHLMAVACPHEYIPWLLLSAWAGIRAEEMFQDTSSEKSPLDWADFKWKKRYIAMRPETTKLGQARVVPITTALAKALNPYAKEKGRVMPLRPPFRSTKNNVAVTKTLRDLVGGWRVNALRHSFISYRAAQVGLAQTAMEAGNSEAEARRSYNDAKTKKQAAAWFSSELLRNRLNHPS